MAELERLTRQYPYREELRALHMLALYRAGRQAEALRAFQVTREVLGEDLGIDPSPRLRRLEEQILLQDPELDPAPAARSAAGAEARAENPYMGLRAFRESDASRFFGQDALVAQLFERVTGTGTFTAVVGPSGSGKSSAVQAGLVPQLRRDSPDVHVAMLQPGSQPFAELEAALDRARGERRATLNRLRATDAGLLDAAVELRGADTSRLLLVVDQFEELFTLADAEEAEHFLAALVVAARDARRRVHVLITIRADFYDRPLATPEFAPLFAENVVNVVPLGPEQLEAAATLPARQLDLSVEPRLVGRLIADVAGQPNALPLFQYALTELFDERAGPVLDLATYERIGGVRKAVARRAESLYTKLDESEQDAVRQLFLRIATVSGNAVGRRRVPASELTALDVEIVALQSAIDSFARYRLLALDRDATTGAPTVEVAHEALLAEWHRLRDWIDESREDLAMHARLCAAMHEWEASGRDSGYLLSGSRLDDYEHWAATSQLKLTATECAFIDQAVTVRAAETDHARERESEAARLRRRSHRQLVTLLVAIAALAGIVAYPIVAADDGRRGQIAIALESPRELSTFDELVARGVEEAADDHGLNSIVLEPPYGNVAQTYVDLAEDADIVFGTFLMRDIMSGLTASHPDSTWVFLDSSRDTVTPNTVDVAFAHEEGAFLAGAAAALETQTGRIGYIGANKSPGYIEAFRAGFEQGARAARPDVEVVAALIAPDDEDGVYGYDDSVGARRIAEWMYLEEQVDVIFTAAGLSGRGVVDAASELSDDAGRHLWAIGVDTDFIFELTGDTRDNVLTSMVKRYDVAVERVVAAHEAGTLVPGLLRLGLAEHALGYSTSGNKMRASTITTLADLEATIVSGAMEVDSTPAGALREPPTPPEAPDTPETHAALTVANEHFAALEANDVDAVMAQLHPDATISYFGLASRDQFELLLTLDAEVDPTYLDVRCVPHTAPRGVQVECTYNVLDGVARRVGAPVVPETATITIENRLISSVRRVVGQPDYGVVYAPFEAWMTSHHPSDLEALQCCREDVGDAQQRGRLRARYADEWAEYLQAEGCRFDAGC